MSMDGEEQDQGELRPQLSPIPSSPENTPTSSYRIQGIQFNKDKPENDVLVKTFPSDLL